MIKTSGQHLQAPDAGRVVQRRVQLPRSPGVTQVTHVPHVHTVVIIDAGQPAVGGVVGHRHSVGVTGLRTAGKQLTERGATDWGVRGCGIPADDLQALNKVLTRSVDVKQDCH